MSVDDAQLKGLLIENNLITEADFENAEKIANHLGCLVTDVLIGRNVVKEDDLGRILSIYYKVDYINLRKIDIPSDVINIIPENIAAEKGVIAFALSENELYVAFEDPDDLAVSETVKKTVGPKYQIRVFVAMPQIIKSAIKLYKKNEGNLENVHLKTQIASSSVSLVNDMLESAIRQEASDIHIEPLPDKMLVRFRIDGVLHDDEYWVKEVHPSTVARIKILSDLKIDETRLPQDGQFAFTSKSGEKVSLRVSVIPSVYGEKIVLRILKSGVTLFNLDELGMLPEDQEVIFKILKRTHGMFLVTGPTGSGKTTTLYTILGLLNKPDVNIVTIEDPVENKITRVNQIQVNSGINLTFANGLRSILRQDPDIVMVGEIRDTETALISINAAMTGHLVFSSVHANTSAGAIPRMIDLGAEPFLIASTLNMVVAQRLVRVLCPNCKSESPMSNLLISKLEEMGEDVSPSIRGLLKSNFTSAGCGYCFHTGYKGRIGIFETLLVDDNIRKMIYEKQTSDTIWRVARESKTKSMLEDGLIKVSKGLTTIEEVLRVIST
jgi:type IV pilus assembly protein PilB